MNQTKDPLITLTLPLSGVNGLLAGASRLPYADVAGLIHEVQQQANEQLLQLQAEQQAAPAAPAVAPLT